MRETMNALACELLGAVIEKRDDGASRIERDGQSWFRVSLGPDRFQACHMPVTTAEPLWFSHPTHRRMHILDA